MKYKNIDEALRNSYDDDDFVIGFKTFHVKTDEDRDYYMAIIEENKMLTPDDLSIIGIEREEKKEIDINTLRLFFSKQAWIFAKTYADT